MVDFAKTHHPNNCFQDNRNHFDNGNVAPPPTTAPTAPLPSASKDFLSSFCNINDATTTTIESIGCNGSRIPWQKQQYRNHSIKNAHDDADTKRNDSDCCRRRCQLQHHHHHHHHRYRTCQQHNRKNAPIFHCNRMQTTTAAGVLSRVHGIIVISSYLSNLLLFFTVLSLLILHIDVIKAEPQQPIKATATTRAKLSSAAASSSSSSPSAAVPAATKTTTATDQQCEPKVLDETPPDPVS